MYHASWRIVHSTYLVNEYMNMSTCTSPLRLGPQRGFQEGKWTCHLTPCRGSPSLCSLALPTANSTSPGAEGPLRSGAGTAVMHGRGRNRLPYPGSQSWWVMELELESRAWGLSALPPGLLSRLLALAEGGCVCMGTSSREIQAWLQTTLLV